MGALIAIALFAAMSGASWWIGQRLGPAIAPDINRVAVFVVTTVDRLRSR